MPIDYKDIGQLSQKASVAGTEKIEVSDTEYITPSQIAGLVSVSGKADKVSSATSGDFAGLDSNGNLTDSGKKASDFIHSTEINGETTAMCVNFYDGGNDTSFALPGSDAAPDCDYIIEIANNKVSSWSSTTNDYHYPSEKLVKDSLDAKQATLVSGTNIKTINNESILGSGNITVGGGSTTDCVHKTGDETVGGDKTFTDDIIVGDASNIKYGASSGSGFTRGYATRGGDTNDLDFQNLAGEPKAFIISPVNSITDVSGDTVIAVIGDSTGTHTIYTTGTQHNYSTSATTSYSNGTFTVSFTTALFGDFNWQIVYYYGDGTLTFKTSQVQPGSGVTAVTFTGTDLTEVPAMYALMLETQVNNESYRRVAYYTNESGGASATPMGVSFYSSQIHNTTSNFSASYSNGLYINSGGTNAGGYFHNPGTYTLYYLMASDIGGGGGGSYNDLAAELSAMNTSISAKQDALVSGTNIKTINSTSLLGSGNIAISSLPTVTATNNGQLLEVSNGAWAAGRTITISSSEPTAYQGNNGDIWIVI